MLINLTLSVSLACSTLWNMRLCELIMHIVDTCYLQVSAESWSEQLPISIVNVLNMSPVFSLYTKGAVGCGLTNW